MRAMARSGWGCQRPRGEGPSLDALPVHCADDRRLTNAIESINARLRKIIKTRGHFPSDAVDKFQTASNTKILTLPLWLAPQLLGAGGNKVCPFAPGETLHWLPPLPLMLKRRKTGRLFRRLGPMPCLGSGWKSLHTKLRLQ